MISSTTKDLPDHRKEAIDAVLRCNMFPLIMETLGATGNDPITDSLAMVEQSDIYILILGRRYGYIPDDLKRNPERLSITQMEYELAKKRAIPRYTFVMDDEHPITQNRSQLDDIESNEHRKKFTALKNTVTTEDTVAFFKSSQDLRGLIIHALNKHDSVYKETVSAKPTLPTPPNLFAAPPHKSARFVGRANEREQLNNWVEENNNPIMVIRAIGGQGKSAVMWHWVQQKNQSYKGIIWWNFDKGSLYEPDGGHVQTFLRYAIAYMNRQHPDDFKDMSYPKLIQQFINLVQHNKYLIVLDGLERILVAYNRFDSSHLYDESIQDDEDLRDCINPQDFSFLRHLVDLQKSKILIGTRLFPTALEDKIGNALDGVSLIQLSGIDPLDARKLMGKLGVRFSDHKKLNQFMAQLGYHGLMLILAAGHIAKYRRAPGNFDEWYEAYSIETWKEEADELRNEILEFAIDGLSDEKRQFLEDISAFRGTMTHEMIDPFNPYLPPMSSKLDLPLIPPTRNHPFCISDDEAIEPVSAQTQARIIKQRQIILDKYKKDYEASNEWIQAQSKFDMLLTELEDRGLIEWNRNDWTYDLHPVVRAFAHGKLDGERRSEVYMKIQDHFASLVPLELKGIKELSELDDAVEYYLSSLNSGNIKQAVSFYRYMLNTPLLSKLNDYQTILRLLKPIINNHLGKLDVSEATIIRHNYALALEATGKVEAAANFVSGNFVNDISANKPANLAVSLIVYARHIMLQNKLVDVEKILSIAEEIVRASNSTRQLAWVQEYQIELYTLMGSKETVKNLEHEIILDRKNPDFFANDRIDLAIQLADTYLDFEEDAYELIDELSQRLEQNWKHSLERKLHRIRAKQAIIDRKFDIAEHELIQTIRMSNENGRSVALSLARLALIWQGKNSPKANRAMSDAVKRWSYNKDKPLIYTLATEFYTNAKQKDKALSYLHQAIQYAMNEGTPYIHKLTLEKIQWLAHELDFEMPTIPENNTTQSTVPFEKEIIDYLNELKDNPLKTSKSGNLAPTIFNWEKVNYSQVLAVCEFNGLNSMKDDRVWDMVCEIHGLSTICYDTLLHVYKDDSTETEKLDRPIQQILPSEAKALRLYNDLKPDMGTITLITSQDDDGDFYAIVYCLAEEILRFAIACQSGDPLELNDYFVKLLYEGRGTCISKKHQAELESAYKIKGYQLALIHA